MEDTTGVKKFPQHHRESTVLWQSIKQTWMSTWNLSFSALLSSWKNLPARAMAEHHCSPFPWLTHPDYDDSLLFKDFFFK